MRLFSVISRTLTGEILPEMQRCSWCILQPQPTGQAAKWIMERSMQGIFLSQYIRTDISPDRSGVALLFVDFSKGFDSTLRKDKANNNCIWYCQINYLWTKDALQDTRTMDCSSDSDGDFFDCVDGVLWGGDTLACNLFVTCLNYIPPTSIDLIKENDLTLKTAKSRRYPAETMQTIHMRKYGLQIHLRDQNVYFITGNCQQEVLASMRTQIKLSSWVLHDKPPRLCLLWFDGKSTIFSYIFNIWFFVDTHDEMIQLFYF